MTNYMANQVERAQALRQKYTSGQAFILPEVWDVASARVLQDAGFDVMGTSATAIAWVNGYRPHERVNIEDLLMSAARIIRGSSIPINADLEGGVGRSVDDVKKAVQAAIAVGCAGVTIGDGSRNGAHGVMPLDEMANRIKAARMAAMAARVPMVITARSDVFQLGPLGHSPFDTAVERSAAYFDAGADNMLVPGIQHLQIVERLAKHCHGPVSITISLANAPDIEAYRQSGIACITLGPSLLRSLLGNMRLKAEELLTEGHFTHLDRAIPQDELEALFR